MARCWLGALRSLALQLRVLRQSSRQGWPQLSRPIDGRPGDVEPSKAMMGNSRSTLGNRPDGHRCACERRPCGMCRRGATLSRRLDRSPRNGAADAQARTSERYQMCWASSTSTLGHSKQGHSSKNWSACRVRHCKSQWSRGPGHMTELLEYTSPDGRQTCTPRSCDVGSVHVAFYVANIDALLARIASVGWLPVGDVQTAEAGERAGLRLAYVPGPDGVMIEFLQLPQDGPTPPPRARDRADHLPGRLTQSRKIQPTSRRRSLDLSSRRKAPLRCLELGLQHD